jgi:hypothetical protein
MLLVGILGRRAVEGLAASNVIELENGRIKRVNAAALAQQS